MYRVGMCTAKIYDENYPLDKIEECCNCFASFEKAVESSAEGQCEVCKGCKDCPESRKECNQWSELTILASHATTEEDLYQALIEGAKQGIYRVPWSGSFRSFMRDKNNKLVFS